MARLRMTGQKALMESELSLFSVLFDADLFYAQIRRKNSKIGIATVYRFLKGCVEEGKLHAYSCNRKAVFSVSSNSHCHFTCKDCGEVTHINLEKVDFLQRSVKGDICHFQIDVSGICANCKREMVS